MPRLPVPQDGAGCIGAPRCPLQSPRRGSPPQLSPVPRSPQCLEVPSASKSTLFFIYKPAPPTFLYCDHLATTSRRASHGRSTATHRAAYRVIDSLLLHGGTEAQTQAQTGTAWGAPIRAVATTQRGAGREMVPVRACWTKADLPPPPPTQVAMKNVALVLVAIGLICGSAVGGWE
jgi:hypothetical protein